MSTANNVHREIVAAWNRRDFTAYRNLLHPEYTYTGGDGKEMTGGPDTGEKIARMYAEAFPDATLEVKSVYTQGNIAIAEMRGQGTQSGPFMGIVPTNRRAEITICNVMELRDGKIYREREYFDMMNMLTQLGVVSWPGQAAGA